MKKFGDDVIKPLVAKMDADSSMDQKVIDGLFHNGFMGIEVPHDYDGPGATFFDAILIVEELAKVVFSKKIYIN